MMVTFIQSHYRRLVCHEFYLLESRIFDVSTARREVLQPYRNATGHAEMWKVLAALAETCQSAP